MTKIQTTKMYDLEDRTAKFAKETRLFVNLLPKTLANIEDIKQLVRSSGSVGANYIVTERKLPSHWEGRGEGKNIHLILLASTLALP